MSFREEVCRHREDYFADEPAFRLLHESPKSRLIDPPEMVGAMEEAGVDRRGGYGLSLAPGAPLAPPARSDPRSHAPLSPDPHRVLRGAQAGARRPPGGRALPGRGFPGRGRAGLV